MIPLPALILGLAFITALTLFLFFLGVTVIREFAHASPKAEVKAKRDDHSRLALGDDGEIIDVWEEAHDHAQRSRNS